MNETFMLMVHIGISSASVMLEGMMGAGEGIWKVLDSLNNSNDII